MLYCAFNYSRTISVHINVTLVRTHVTTTVVETQEELRIL
jgi:hypothetical protein